MFKMLNIWHKDFKLSDDLIKDLINENLNEFYFKDLKAYELTGKQSSANFQQI